MKRRSVILVSAALFAIPSVSLADASSAPTMKTSAGIEIAAPVVSSASCQQIRAVFDALDRSGYRKNSPTPLSDKDRIILAYESRLSAEYFWRCSNNQQQPVGNVANDSYNDNAFKYGYLD